MERLKLIHERLANLYQERASEKGDTGHLHFLADHDLDEHERRETLALVRETLRWVPVERPDWSSSYLPLLVCAVEVGYGYLGNGTDFWPTLESAIGYRFSFEDRCRLSRWFRRCSERYRGVQPGETDWERVFRHIAWPITHAVAAADIRQPFADCLRRFRGNISDEDTEIVEKLAAINSTVDSRRFRTWLSRRSVVAGIVRDLLGGPNLVEAGLFGHSFRDRLIRDLQAEPAIYQAIRQFRAGNRARTTSSTSAAASGKQNTQACTLGSFFLRRNADGSIAFFGELPVMPREVQMALRATRRVWQPRPWGRAGCAPLPAATLRSSRGSFEVDLHYAVSSGDGRPFFVGHEELPIDADSKLWLDSVRLIGSDRLVFSPLDDEEDSTAFQIKTPPTSGPVWIAAKSGVEWPDACQHVAELQGGEVREAEASDPVFRLWIGWTSVRSWAALETSEGRWIHPTPIAYSGEGHPVFTADDVIGYRTKPGSNPTLVLLRGRKEFDRTVVQGSSVVTPLSAGEYELRLLEGSQCIDRFSFSVIEDDFELDPPLPWRLAVARADTGETSLTRSDLFGKRILINIESDRAVEDLELRVSLSPGRASASIWLERLPTRIGPKDPVWDVLLQQLSPAVYQSACDIDLRIDAGGIVRGSWRLEAPIQELWWEDKKGELPRAVSDEGELLVERCSLITESADGAELTSGPVLSTARGPDGNEYLFDARITAIGGVSLNLLPPRPVRLLRTMEDSEGGLGLQQIAARYLRVATASSSSVAAEISRVGVAQRLKSWLLESICGEEWGRRLSQLVEVEEVEPLDIWWTEQQQRPILQPEPQDGVPYPLPLKVTGEFRATLDSLLPDAWWDGRMDEVKDASRFDPTFIAMTGQEVFVDADALTSSLRDAGERLCGGILADLIIPANGGDELLATQIVGLSVEELAILLSNWARRHLRSGRGRARWSDAELRDFLMLLTSPDHLRRREWVGMLQKLLGDRPIARAGAYLAWRYEQTVRLSSMRKR